MNCTDPASVSLAQLHALEHPRYFYGQLLGVRHFESEHEYFKAKMWMLNRLVNGYGVVCGLDVKEAPNEPGSVIVTPGLALDKWGREIVVAAPSAPVKVEPYQPPEGEQPPPREGGNGEKDDGCNDDRWVHLVICYRECATGPEPVLAGGCETPSRCSHGTVRESYCLSIQPGKAERLQFKPELGDPFRARPFNYGELVRWVTSTCQPCADTEMDPCIPLANIRRPAPNEHIEEIDIEARPLVYSLDLLFELMLASQAQQATTQRGGRPYRSNQE